MTNRARFRCGVVFAIALQLSQGVIAEESFLGKLIPDPLNPLLHDLFPITSQKNLSQEDEATEAKISDEHQKLLNAGSSIDYFHDMDNGFTNRPAELQKILNIYVPGITEKESVARMARGRNNWIVWTFGNDKFWTNLGRSTFGGLDFLKTISSHPNLPTARSNRWETLGVVNEPCFIQAPDKPTAQQPDPWGIRLDQRIVSADCPKDPFDDPKLYPGIEFKNRKKGNKLRYKGKLVDFDAGSFYGRPTGIVGFRLFNNPDFDQAAADYWDPDKFYNDPEYFNNPKLVRPYRVGVSCALCHVGPNPIHPPADFNNPTWADLNSNPGAQYFWVDRIFMWNWKKMPSAKYPDAQNNFVFQLVHSSRPGTLDTSLVSSDQINNPRTMNAVYDLPARINAGVKFNSSELLTGDETLNMQFGKLPNQVLPESSPLRGTSKNTDNGQLVISPRVLKDGSDSVGALGALNRVYVNIGLFSEEWVQHFIPLIGGPSMSPFPIKVAQQNSVMWKANVEQTPDLALFFLASAKPDKLENAPGGKNYLKSFDGPEVSLGKKVFAENCAACHSSKIPERGYSFFNNPKDPNMCRGENYMKCWNDYWNYTQSPEFKSEMTKIVEQKDFLENNFLSTDLRIPVSLTDSQLCSPIATNAIKNETWDNFSSTTYKELTSIGEFTVNYPLDNGSTMVSESVVVPGGGRGYLRPPSLISVWSTAPFLQNNSLGLFDMNGTVAGRMRSFDDSIFKLLNPNQRANPLAPKVSGMETKEVFYKSNQGHTLPGEIDVTTQESYIKIPKVYFKGIAGSIYYMIKEASLLHPFSKKNFEKKSFDYVTFPGNKALIDAIAKQNAKDNKGRKAASEYGFSADFADAKMGKDVLIGPIPAGVPINLLSNLNLEESNFVNLAKAIKDLVVTTTEIKIKGLKGAQALRYFMKGNDRGIFSHGAAKSLIEASRCADFVVNRGHYFGTEFAPNLKTPGYKALTAEEKSALTQYLKYF